MAQQDDQISKLSKDKKAMDESHKKTLEDLQKEEDKGIKFTSCLPMVGGSLQVLRLLPRLKLVAMIYM